MTEVPRRRAALCAVAALAAACGGRSGPEAGPPRQPSPAPVLEIVEILIGSQPVAAQRASFLAPADRVTVRAQATGAPQLEKQIRWTVTPRNARTGPAVMISSSEGEELIFQAASRPDLAGSRQPNPPLEYEVVASLEVGGKQLQASVPKTSPLGQDEIDILRQEYLDYQAPFRPTRANVGAPSRSRFNTGNYTLIAEEKPNALETLLTRATQHANALLNNDVQKQPVGKTGLAPTDVVVDPGPAINEEVGPLGDTDPEGDDRCAGPPVDGACASAILAGPNGIAETRANNRRTQVNLERFISSAYRNPQRNRAAGSTSVNSRHTRGLALDIDPRTLPVKGKSAPQLMCVIEQAGALAVAPSGKSFTEHGATTFLDCDSPQADHVHFNL